MRFTLKVCVDPVQAVEVVPVILADGNGCTVNETTLLLALVVVKHASLLVMVTETGCALVNAALV